MTSKQTLTALQIVLSALVSVFIDLHCEAASTHSGLTFCWGLLIDLNECQNHKRRPKNGLQTQ